MTSPSFSKVRPNSASTVYVLTERRGGHEVNGHGYNGDGNGKVRRSWAAPWWSSRGKIDQAGEIYGNRWFIMSTPD